MFVILHLNCKYIEFASFLKDGKIDKTPAPVTFGAKKRDVQALLEKLKSGPLETHVFVAPQMNVTLVGTPLTFGPVKVTMHNAVLQGDITELQSMMSSIKNDEIIEFTLKSSGETKDIYELLRAEANSQSFST